MNKVFTLLLITALSAISSAVKGEEIEFKLDVDHPERVTVMVNDVEQTALTTGINTINAEATVNVEITAKSGYMLESVTSKWGDEFIAEQTLCSFRIYPGDEIDNVYTVRTLDPGESRTASCTITVDDASKVRITRSGSNTDVELDHNGENTVTFLPETEKEFTIRSTDDYKPLYKVIHNSTALSGEEPYKITVADGDHIDIQALYPDVDCPVHFEYEGDDARDFITGVTVDDVQILDYSAPGFSVKMGSYVTVSGDTQIWACDAFEVNGKTIPFISSASFIVTEETTVKITVHKYATLRVTVDIDTPENVNVYRGFYYNNDLIQLTTGRNDVEISRNNPLISLMPADGCYLTSVTLGSYEYDRDELHRYPVRLDRLIDGDEIVIRTGIINRDMTAAVFIDDITSAEGYLSIARADGSVLDNLANGYTVFQFYDGDNDFTIDTGGPVEVKHVYINDIAKEPVYPESPKYTVSLADGDVVKIFYAGTPELHSVSFDLEAGAKATAIHVIRDAIRRVADWTGGFEALTGTTVTLAPDNGCTFSAEIDGQTLTPDALGQYSFTVTADTTVKITDITDGLTDIATSPNAVGPIYNLQGIEVGRDGDSISTLPSGIYIRNGIKFIKR